ncbi:peptidase M23B [Roseibium sp. TrichSKD4]|uniref:M23 family metallopeptidase n=1 Tax=Roseibium sp. TrichSKD4 TaxID=744980 RepID=UPI0001E567C9|nr:M23 family metallopeptidase [Roseibium sp. TrichSKD4]EFO30500.1 peptidase M23B [Roseibium sp. TrichSKD4]
MKTRQFGVQLGHFAAILCAAFGVGGLPSTALAGEADLKLTVPVSCDLGSECFVQNYVDLDPGPGVLDVMCGTAAYDGHKGTDFRVLNIGQTADVLAAASGTVTGIRNSVSDRLIQSELDRAAVKGTECGNGLVINHGDGWETQYCHMRRGSVAVKPGQKVERGAFLGKVGYSGLAEFAHLHLSVRKDGRPIDPFLGTVDAGKQRKSDCVTGLAQPLGGNGLWLDDIRPLLRDAQGALLESGFSGSVVKPIDLEAGGVEPAKATSAALVFFARFINVQKGDRILMTVTGPDGFKVRADNDPLPKNKAHWVSFVGKKLRGDRWPSGTYQGEAALVRDGKVLLRTQENM